MMKINTKYFKQTIGEPFEVQDVNGEKVELYYLDEQPYYNEFISRGKFFFWASDGKESKLIMESGYHNVMKELFTADVNRYWIDYYDKADAVNTKTRNAVVLPLLIGYITFFVLYVFVLSRLNWFKDAMWFIFIAIIIIMFVAMSKINKYIKGKIDILNSEAISKIKKIVGKKEYERLLKEQDKYRDFFYKIEDEELDEQNATKEEESKDEDENEEEKDSMLENVVEDIKDDIKNLSVKVEDDPLDADSSIVEETVKLNDLDEEKKEEKHE